jgi:thymidine kinase
MAKLYFRYGTVGSTKTLNLLAVTRNYKQQGKNILLIKPELNSQAGDPIVEANTGLEQSADLVATRDTVLEEDSLLNIDCILVDDAHFLSTKLIEQLRDIVSFNNIPVICYGLRADFRSNLFEGSKRLIELADSIEEIKTTCTYCNKKATQNLKLVNDVATIAGPSVETAADEKFFPVCHRCYVAKLEAAWQEYTEENEKTAVNL